MNRTLFLATCLTLFSAGTALADSIDGTWCMTDGRSLSIDGPKLITPAGTRMTGNYDRHGFSYTVPAPETGAGATVKMVLMGETMFSLTRSDRQGTAIWRRCTITPTS